MKKQIFKKIILTCVLITSSILLAGCNKDVEAGEGFTKLKVEYAGVNVTPGEAFNVNDIKNGKTPDISKVKGCAMYGFNHIYTYDDIEINANIKDDESEEIYSVFFIGDNVSTPEGIKIGSSVDEMLNAYGNEYDEFNGVYTYTGVGVFLTIQTNKDVVTSIEYTMVTN